MLSRSCFKSLIFGFALPYKSHIGMQARFPFSNLSMPRQMHRGHHVKGYQGNGETNCTDMSHFHFRRGVHPAESIVFAPNISS